MLLFARTPAILALILWSASSCLAADKPLQKVPQREHFAFCNCFEYLDGPRLEAMSGRSPNLAWDERGNIYFFATFWYGAIRCIRTDGRVVTIAGNDYWTPDLNLSEGPASAFPSPTGGSGTNFSYPSGGIAVQGAPDEGEDKGCIYVASHHGGIYRIFRNKSKNNRWWFAQAIGFGKAAVPRKRGETVAAKSVNLSYVSNLQIGLNGRLQLFVKGSFLEYHDGKLTCLLGPEDYVGKADNGGPRQSCSEGYLAGDGSFYLGTYYDGEGYGSRGVAIYRAKLANGIVKVEPVAKAQSSQPRDGNALTEAGWFCGPHFAFGRNEARYQPPNVVFTSSHDEATLRRILDGRSATLCSDGQWREVTKGDPKTTPWWFHMCRIGPDGTFYQIYRGGDWGTDQRMYRITGIDSTRPTAK